MPAYSCGCAPLCFAQISEALFLDCHQVDATALKIFNQFFSLTEFWLRLRVTGPVKNNVKNGVVMQVP